MGNLVVMLRELVRMATVSDRHCGIVVDDLLIL